MEPIKEGPRFKGGVNPNRPTAPTPQNIPAPMPSGDQTALIAQIRRDAEEQRNMLEDIRKRLDELESNVMVTCAACGWDTLPDDGAYIENGEFICEKCMEHDGD